MILSLHGRNLCKRLHNSNLSYPFTFVKKSQEIDLQIISQKRPYSEIPICCQHILFRFDLLLTNHKKQCFLQIILNIPLICY